MQALSRKYEEFIRFLAQRIVPEAASLDESGRRRLVEIIDQALMARPAAVRRQVNLFLRLLRFSSVARHGRTLERLDAPVQDEILRRFQDHPVPRLRRGFWGLKTLVFMGYYGQPDIAETLHWAPSRKGNEMLHD